MKEEFGMVTIIVDNKSFEFLVYYNGQDTKPVRYLSVDDALRHVRIELQKMRFDAPDEASKE